MSPEKERLMNRLSKIKAHHESAKAIGNVEEAQAFAEGLQKLLAQHKLTMSDVQWDCHLKEEDISTTKVRWSEHNMRSTRKRCSWMEALAALVAKAHGCRTLVIQGSNTQVFVGRPSDMKVAEYCLVVLAQTAERVSVKEYDKFYAACERDSMQHEARGYRAAWLSGFVSRIGARFNEITEAQKVAAAAPAAGGGASTCTDLMRLSGKDVEAWMGGQKYGKGERLNKRNTRNGHGFNDGKEYADGINLNSRGVEKDNNKQLT